MTIDPVCVHTLRVANRLSLEAVRHLVVDADIGVPQLIGCDFDDAVVSAIPIPQISKMLLLALWEMQASLDQMIKEKNAAYDAPAWMQAGEFHIYHYCPCERCTGKNPGDRDYGITATGAVATEGRTIAVDPDVIPLGSEVLINDVIYIAEDVGVKGKTIDIFVADHARAVEMGTYLTAVSWR